MNSNVGRWAGSNIWAAARQFLSAGGKLAGRTAPGPSFSFARGGHSSRFARFSGPQFFRLPPKSSKYVLSRSFVSGSGFWAFGTTSSTTAAEATVNTCTNSVEKGLCSGSGLSDKRKILYLARSGWRRGLHGSSHRSNGAGKRNNTPTTGGNGRNGKKGNNGGGSKPAATSTGRKEAKSALGSAAAVAASGTNGSQFLNRLSHLHAPTKDELLAAATGFWSRMRIRFKWFSIRSLRPFNTDELTALISWVLAAHLLWVVLGTTTFFSLAILMVNTVFAQETLAAYVGNYLTKETGVKVVFESAIVPKWKDGVISFKNVFVSRRPGQGKSKVSKGSATTAAAAAAAAAKADETNQIQKEEEEDVNYTHFDLTVDTVNVTLSFTKWWNGKGPLKDVDVKGVRGVVDRTQVHWEDDDVDPRTYRHQHHPGDFEIDNFKMEDLLVTVHQPGGFRPFSVSIFSADLPQLRKQWLFYDFLSATNVSGSFDDSLFTIHPRQTHTYTDPHFTNGIDANGESSPWKKHSRLRIDGLNIDHLNRGVEGPFSWIQTGTVDIVADVMFPADDEESIAKVMSDIYDRIEATVTARPGDGATSAAIESSTDQTDMETRTENENDKRFVVFDLRINLNDVRAAVPIFTQHLSYVNSALIRPIVAYINSRRTFIPINCRVVKRSNDFDGSWTIFDSGLMDDLSAETYEAFARDVMDDQARRRRLKKVGLWSLQLAIQALFLGMAGNIA